MNVKPVTMEEAVAIVMNGEARVYMLTQVTDETTVRELGFAERFVIEVDPELQFPAEPEQWTESDDEEELEEDEKPDEDDEEIAEDPEEEDEPEDETTENEDEPAPAEDTKPSAVHQKIVNMYLAGRTIKYIAQELGKSAGTVHYHLRKEGLV